MFSDDAEGTKDRQDFCEQSKCIFSLYMSDAVEFTYQIIKAENLLHATYNIVSEKALHRWNWQDRFKSMRGTGMELVDNTVERDIAGY